MQLDLTDEDELALLNPLSDAIDLLIELADARTAAMFSGSEAAALRSRLELLTDRRPWWRRWLR